MKSLEGKVALVTGGASGLGKAIALRFAEDGAKVCIADVTDEAGGAAAQAVDGRFVHTDVSDPAAVEAAIAAAVNAAGRLDVMVNCAGIVSEQASIHAIDLDYWHRLIAINLNGTMYGMKYALAQFMEQGDGGNIINMSSISGISALADSGGYAVTKAGIVQLTRLAAIEYGEYGIRVNALAPTGIMTPITQAYIDESPDPVATRKALEAYNPIKGMPTPEDVASAAAFLASDDARFISGVILPVDGAFTAR